MAEPPAAGGGGCGEPPPHPGGLPSGSLAEMASRIDNSYMRTLRPDPDEGANAPNTRAREVFSGHYVRVQPKAMAAPYLVAYSRELAGTLGLDPAECESAAFLRIFSGDLRGAPAGFAPEGWATPYANSIYGEPIANPAPQVGPNGYGYGDGRAISIAEVLLPGAAPGAPPGPARLELQLKGAGPTPFRRSGEGFAVLRSSVREFLASEAMHALGVPTTRALCLVASEAPQDLVVREWEGRVQRNIRAITTRVARSLLRVGQFELYGRRAARGERTGVEELALLARHALAREYPDLVPADASPAALQGAVLGMLRQVSMRLASMAAHWMRVGYVQSNFNADNCLVGGVTMDYGPFGFVQEYDPDWGMWVGSGRHFAFSNQPTAAAVNFGQLLKSLLPLLDAAGVAEAQGIYQEHPRVSARVLGDMYASKLGFPAGAKVPTQGALLSSLLELMASYPTDYTILWRQLAHALPEDLAATLSPEADERQMERCLEALRPAFIKLPPQKEGTARKELPEREAAEWKQWLRKWHATLSCLDCSSAEVAASMKAVNPKYVPREWMLVGAYAAAQEKNFGPMLELHELFKRPYDEQPEFEARFYKYEDSMTKMT